jgi:thiamine biosynthesis lipoprotein
VKTDCFESMGCEVIVGGATRRELRAIEELFAERDRVFSRFRPDSELNRVNRSAGRFVAVSPLFAQTLAVALRAARETDGLVDPTLGGALEGAGYDRDFASLAPVEEPPGAGRPGAWRSVLLIGRRVGLPHGLQLDLNGVVKSLAVDDALKLLSGPGPGFVSAGGDVAACDELTVALPDGESVLLRQGALATSSSAKRRWMRAGQVQHHLVDPATGRPSESPWEQVTACGASCLAADVAAKAGFLLGEDGPGWLDRRRIPARFLSPRGSAVANESWTVACT